MKYDYILETIESTGESYRWKQIAVSNDFNSLKRIADTDNRFRIFDVRTGIDEVYKNAPDTHFGLLSKAMGY